MSLYCERCNKEVNQCDYCGKNLEKSWFCYAEFEYEDYTNEMHYCNEKCAIKDFKTNLEKSKAKTESFCCSICHETKDWNEHNYIKDICPGIFCNKCIKAIKEYKTDMKLKELK